MRTPLNTKTFQNRLEISPLFWFPRGVIKTAESMVDIMNSKTAAEKEFEHQVAETKAKLAKVPSYVKYIVWCGILFFVGEALLFISLVFYDSMGWGIPVVVYQVGLFDFLF